MLKHFMIIELHQLDVLIFSAMDSTTKRGKMGQNKTKLGKNIITKK